MPFEMDYTDVGGGNHPESYWVIKFLSANDPNKTGHLIFFGYHDSASYDVGLSHIGEHRYDITDPAFYEDCFGAGRYPQTGAFFQILEDRTPGVDGFFDTATALSFVKVQSVEIGSAGSSKIAVPFPVEVAGANFTDGVAIKINGVAATLVSATKSPVNVLTYTIAEVAETSDTVTWEYARSLGALEDTGSARLQSFTPRTAENTVGQYWQFNEANNSGQFAVHF